MHMKHEDKYILRNEHIRQRAIGQVKAVKIGEKEKMIEVIIRPHKKNRTIAQNRLLHYWLRIICDDTGNDIDDLRHDFAARFLPPKIYPGMDGKTRIRITSTSELKTDEFAQFLRDIEQFAHHELDINLPHPEDMWYEAMGKAA